MTVVINPYKCAAPTSVAVSTAGVVTWTNSATSACTTHQVKVASGSYATATSGVNKNSDIVAATGSRTVSVIAKAPNANYSDSDAGSKSVTVYSVALTKGTGISAVSGAGNFISGAKTTISATVSTGWTWKNWTGTSTLTSNSNEITVDGNKTWTANTTVNALTFTAQTLTAGTYNTAYSKAFTGASNGSGTYTYAITGVTLDGTALTASSGKYNGMSLSGTTISGTPTAKGTYVFTIKATDSNTGATKEAAMTVVINPADPTCPTLTAYSGLSDNSAHTITVTGGSGGTIQYRTSTTGTWDETLPTRTGAGTTTIYVQVEGDDNHNTKDCGSSTVKLYNARIDFNAEDGTIINSGTNPIYVRKNNTAVYTTRTASTAATIPIARLGDGDGYSFDGWYTDSTNGTKVIDKNGTVQASVSGWTDANKKWLLSSTSNNANTNPLYAHYIDDIAPSNLTITNSSNGNWTKDNVTVTITATELGSGIKEYQWYENGAWTTRALTTTDGVGTITFKAARNETIRFRVVDNADNISNEITTNIKIEKTAPTVSFNPNTLSYGKTSNVTVTVADSQSTVKKGQSIKYRWQTSSTCSTTESDYTSTAALSNASADAESATATASASGLTGTYYLCVYSGISDVAGNTSVVTKSGAFVFDNTGPVISVTNADGSTNYLTTAYSINLADGANKTVTFTPTVSATADGSALSTLEYVFDKSTSNPTSGWTATTSGTELSFVEPFGNYYLHVKATDALGNVTYATTNVFRARYRIRFADYIANTSTTKTLYAYENQPSITVRTPGERSGYTFTGWYTNKNGSTKHQCGSSPCSPGDTYTPTQSIVFYAHWSRSLTASDITLELSDTSYEYDGTAKTPTVVVKDNGVEVPSSAYTVSYSNNTNAGTATVTVTGKNTYTNDTLRAFYIDSKSTTFTIAESNTATPGACANPTYNGSAQNLASGATNATYSNNSQTDYKTSGSYTVTVTANANYAFSDGTTVTTLSCNITRRPVTYKADSASKTWDGTALTKNSATLTSGSLVSGHTATFSISGSQTSAGSSTNTLSSVTIKNSGGTDLTYNYNVTKQNGTLTVEKAPTATPGACINPTYNGSAQNLAGNGSYVSYSNNSQTNRGSSNYTVTVTTDDNHTFSGGGTSTTLSCNIAQRTITVTAANKSRDYGVANPTLTYTYSGQVSGQTPGFSGALTTSATTSSNPDDYDITQGTLALADNGTFKAINHKISFTKGTLTVNKLPLAAPSNLTIGKDGTISWSAVTGATGYQYAIGDDDSWHSAGNVTSINKLADITAAVGTKTIYVRAINAGANASPIYSSPGAYSTKSVTVVTMTFATSSSTNGTVDTSTYNVISGVTYSASSNKILIKSGSTTIKTVTATPATRKGYDTAFSSWSSTSGTVNSAVTLTATFTATARKYTIKYHGGTGSVVGQYDGATTWTDTRKFTFGAQYGAGQSVTRIIYANSQFPFAVPNDDSYVFYRWETLAGYAGWTEGYPGSSTVTWNWDDNQYGIGDEVAHQVDIYAKWRRYASCAHADCGTTPTYTYRCIHRPSTATTCSSTINDTNGTTWTRWKSGTDCTGYTIIYETNNSTAGASCYVRRQTGSTNNTCRTSACGWEKNSSGTDIVY